MAKNFFTKKHTFPIIKTMIIYKNMTVLEYLKYKWMYWLLPFILCWLIVITLIILR